MIASGTLQIIAALAAGRFALAGGGAGYARAMATFMEFVFAGVILMTLIGFFVRQEHRDVSFLTASE